jgi:hypothetical protein
MITKDARHTREIKSRIAMAEEAFNKKKTLYISKLGLNIRQKLMKGYVWCTALNIAGTWTIQKAYQKYLDSFEMWRWRRMEKII